jgi:hypothetical protein
MRGKTVMLMCAYVAMNRSTMTLVPPITALPMLGVVPATTLVAYPVFKNFLEAALVKKFGKAGVTRGNKAFDVHANTARVDADVVAAFAFRKYQPKRYSPLLSGYMTGYVEPVGTRFYTDKGLEVTNWPEQHYTRGVNKNDSTNRRFKAIVRAIISLKYEMEAKGIAEAKPIGSYMLECMVYNVSDALFGGYAYVQNVKDCTAVCWRATPPCQHP